ncbi:MAG TPA: RNHCP domain-containing protein [Ktedonobacterales bacterium]
MSRSHDRTFAPFTDCYDLPGGRRTDWDTADDDPPALHKGNRARRLVAFARTRPERAAVERRPRPIVRRARPGRPEEFRCRHCRALVGPVPSGGRHRNHCPFCLHSRHVDDRRMGDRLSACGGTMVPVGVYVRPNGEHALVHRCLDCGLERHNRLAADDDFDRALRLPDLTRHQAWRWDEVEAERGTTA